MFKKFKRWLASLCKEYKCINPSRSRRVTMFLNMLPFPSQGQRKVKLKEWQEQAVLQGLQVDMYGLF